MDEHELFIRTHCPKCIALYQRVEREYRFLLEELGGQIIQCNTGQYGCDIEIDVQDILIWFETAPRDGIEFAYDICLPVDEPNNGLNEPHSVTTILDFIDNNPPPEYEGPGWYDDRITSPTQLKDALQRIIAFYHSPQFAERSQDFNEWYDDYSKKFRKSVDEYFQKS